jgi:predicted AlkP superfamily pyrophosphatase or phosphodiesterase
MSNRTVVLNVVGLSGAALERTPRIRAFREQHASVPIVPAFPAVTCTAQACYLTGLPPSGHGIVGNGWYNRELAEVQFWKQSNHLVHGGRVWDEGRAVDAGFTCAKLFWWYNMYSSANYSITPRPIYPADGRKFFDIYSWPYELRTQIKKKLGEFPFPGFWGPAAGVNSPQGIRTAATDWIAQSAIWVEREYSPALSLVYLPHLDYNLQRFGPDSPRVTADYAEIDSIVGRLLDFYAERRVDVIILSEYGLAPVETPVSLNRVFRRLNWVVVKDELGLEILDAGASRAFAVADHQIAHVYIKQPSMIAEVRAVLEGVSGVSTVLGPEEKAAWGIDHPRAGDLIAVAAENAWFTYYYWLDDKAAPDFARCVDIHRKPGYDPAELFLDPAMAFPKLKILGKLLRKKLGFRMLMDVIPLDASLVKGSHGARPADEKNYPVLISSQPQLLPKSSVQAPDVYHVIRRHIV